MLNEVGRTQKSTDGLEFPDVSSRGVVESRSWKNVDAFLKWTGVEIRRNEFTGTDEVDGEPLNDDTLIELLGQARTLGMGLDIKFLKEGLKAASLNNRYHPVRKFFKELVWDGRKRLDTWLTTYLGVADSEYTRAVGALTLIAAVRRIRKPGSKFDTMLVLEGKQGLGKSSALTDLAVRKEWFTDCASLTNDSKVVIEQTAGKMIVEIPELSGMKKAEIEHVKANLSRMTDRARLAYGYMAGDVPRQFIMIGTVNADADGKAGYLKDHTGNRRFWPVRATKVERSLKRDVKQLWAEAVLREKKTEDLILPKHLWTVAAAKQEQRMERDPIFLSLQDQLGDREGKVLVEDVWSLLGKRAAASRTPDDPRKMGQAMRKLGWVKVQRRADGAQRYFYLRGDSDKTLRLNSEGRLV